MAANVFTAEAAGKARIELITDPSKGRQAVHDVVVAMQANRRSGTACAKTKAEVSASGAKPWRQKGTGRARAGYRSSPVWVGGGVAHGPHPRSYAKDVPKAVKRLAFRKALSERILAGDVLVVDEFTMAEPKTGKFVSTVADQSGGVHKTLIVGAAFDANTKLAARNVKSTLLTTASEVNTEQLLAFDKIIVTQEAVQKLSERLSG